MIKFLKNCRAGMNVKRDSGDPWCCTWMEYDGVYDFIKDDEMYESEVVIEDLEEGIDYEIIE